jgi:pimeloyl-ACP methyl ester carboxylesterase
VSAIWRSDAGAQAVRAQYLKLLDLWPVPSERLTVPTRFGETFVLACGPKDVPPLLLFHGSGANAAMWMRDVVAWAEHFRCYAVDMIGEPGLSAPSRPPLASDAHALWLDDVMAGLGLQRASIVGVSLGGWLALDYATRRPQRAEKLALLCPGGVGRQKSTVLFALPLLFLGRWGRRRLMRFVLGRDSEAAPFMSLTFKHFRPRRERLPVFGDAALKRLTMPVLAIVGARDVLLDSRATKRRLEANVKTAGVRLLPAAGHLIADQTLPILAFLRC